MNQHERSIELCESIGLDPRNTDDLFLHALEIIGAISCITERIYYKTDLETAKQRIFWKTIQEIATQELDDAKDEHGDPANARSVSKMMLTAFPDEKKRTDGRMWLSMHFAVAVPTVELQDIRVIFASQPNLLTTLASISISNGPEDFSVTPCHLAVMAKPPNLALIDLLKMFNRNFGTLVASNKSTPLHVAAEYSNSVALIQHLIQLYPQALRMRDGNDQTPLCCVSMNGSFEALKILEVFFTAAPLTVRLSPNGTLPLHLFLDAMAKKETVQYLLKVFPNAINVADGTGRLPIHIAAQGSNVEILRIITEANPENVSKFTPTLESVAHCAAISETLDNICYIHSMMPKLFQTINYDHQTPLHLRTETFGWSNPDEINEMANLVPETARNVDKHGNNLLHTLVADECFNINLIRLFLRLIPGGALALNNQGQTPYDLITKPNHSNLIVRRLLLLAGAPSLHPETRKQMNYQARKGALIAFFARAFEPNIFYRIRDSGAGRVLMRQVVSFL